MLLNIIGNVIGGNRRSGTTILPFQFTINTNNTSTGSSASNQFKLPLISSLPLNAVVDWGDGSSDTITVWNQAQTTHTYASIGTYTVTINGNLSGWQFNNTGDRLKILNVISWGILNISVSSGFYGCANLTSNATDAPTISSTNLSSYFRNCSLFNGAIGNWDMSIVNTMVSMFNSATSFNQNINTWNTSAVTNMQNMFVSASAFNQSLSSWNTSAVTNMGAMFQSATAFNQNIGGWNISNVTNIANFMSTKTPLTFSTSNLDAIYNGWSSRPVKPNLSISFGTAKYTSASSAGRAILTSAPNNWTITDGGL